VSEDCVKIVIKNAPVDFIFSLFLTGCKLRPPGTEIETPNKNEFTEN